MSFRFGTHFAYLAMRTALFGDASPYGSRNIYLALGMKTISAADLDAVNVGAMSSFQGHEYDGSGYARQLLGSLVTTDGGTLRRWRLMAADADFGVLGPATNPAKSLLLIFSTSASPASDATAYLLGVADGTDFPERNGDGLNPFRVLWTGGIVLFGPNAGSVGTGVAQALSDSLYETTQVS